MKRAKTNKKPVSGKPEKKPKKASKKDPMKPKKASTAYMIFCAENRAQVIQENDGIKQTEIIKKLGEMWAELKKSPDEIQEYIDMAALDKERFQREMDVYSAYQADVKIVFGESDMSDTDN